MGDQPKSPENVTDFLLTVVFSAEFSTDSVDRFRLARAARSRQPGAGIGPLRDG